MAYVVSPFSGKHSHVIKVHHYALFAESMEVDFHGTLKGCAFFHDPKWHSSISERTPLGMEGNLRRSGSVTTTSLYPKNTSSKENIYAPYTICKICSIEGVGQLSLPEARFKFRKSTHKWISLDFLRTRTRMETHVEWWTLYMILASNSFVISLYMRGSSDGITFLNFCWNGLAPSLIGITCWIIRVSYSFRSSYVHANTSRYCFNKWTKACHSCCV